MELIDMQVLTLEEAEKLLLRQAPLKGEQSGYKVMSQEAAEKEAEMERKLYNDKLIELLNQLFEYEWDS